MAQVNVSVSMTTTALIRALDRFDEYAEGFGEIAADSDRTLIARALDALRDGGPGPRIRSMTLIVEARESIHASDVSHPFDDVVTKRMQAARRVLGQDLLAAIQTLTV